MTTHDPYDEWRQARRRELPSAGFTDRVLDAVRESAQVRPAHVAGRRAWTARLIERRKGLLVAAAGVAFAFRLAAAIAVFFPTS